MIISIFFILLKVASGLFMDSGLFLEQILKTTTAESRSRAKSGVAKA